MHHRVACVCYPGFLNYCKFINLIFNDVSECSAYRIPKHTIGVCHGWSEPVLVDQASSHSSWVAEQGQGLWSGPAVERSSMSACTGKKGGPFLLHVIKHHLALGVGIKF